MDCESVQFSRHAIERMFQRSIAPEEVLECIRSGTVVESYADDLPYPSALLLGIRHCVPLHVLLARDAEKRSCYVVTVYRPDPLLWAADFKTRRKP